MASMPSRAQRPATYDDANLLLRLYELRREEKLRAARDWFAKNFHASTLEEMQKLCPMGSQENAYLRMVTGYWDMAASLVSSGAIDGDSFRAAHGEIVGAFAKIQPFLAELRATVSEPDFCKHIEAVVLASTDAEATLKRRRERLRALARQAEASDAR